MTDPLADSTAVFWTVDDGATIDGCVFLNGTRPTPEQLADTPRQRRYTPTPAERARVDGYVRRELAEMEMSAPEVDRVLVLDIRAIRTATRR